MLRALWTASTGMKAQMTNLDVIANNLANANTVGFKKDRADFQDLLYQTYEFAGESTGGDSQDPVGEQVGVGVKLASIAKEFTTGSLTRTDRDLDIAIAGKGFLQIVGPDGEVAYTKDGALKIDGTGNIVNSDGYSIVGLGQVSEDAIGINFSPTGLVSYIDSAGIENTIGDIQLASFVNPSGLNPIGGNLFTETAASGAAVLSSPGLQGTGTLQQHFLELSNVNIVEEMVNLISAQRAYEINSKMIKASDELLTIANSIGS